MICAIVLAAGRSDRMGTQKLLLPLGGQPVITRIVDELIRSPLQQTIVVTGRDGEKIQQAVVGRAVTFTTNPETEGDMLSSVRCGLRTLPATCEAVLVVLGDQPGITHELVAELVRTLRQTKKGIIVPTCEGSRGHPLLFAVRFCDEVLTCFDGEGLHALLTAHPEEVCELAVSTPSALEDMDTPEDYQHCLHSS